MIRSGFNMKRDNTPFSPLAASRHVIPATITSSASCIDLFPSPRLQQTLSATNPFPSQSGGRYAAGLESMHACRPAPLVPFAENGRTIRPVQPKMRGQESHEEGLRHSAIGRTRHDGSIDFSFAAPVGVAIRLGGGIACTAGIPLLCA